MSKRSTFGSRPDIKPVFIPDSDRRQPFLGFQFLEGVVLFGPASESLTYGQKRCFGRACLGQTNGEIAEKLSVTKQVVWRDLSTIYELVGATNRASLLPRALATDVAVIELDGEPSFFRSNEDDLKAFRLLARGRNYQTVAERYPQRTAINWSVHMRRRFTPQGFPNTETRIAAALVTGQLVISNPNTIHEAGPGIIDFNNPD